MLTRRAAARDTNARTRDANAAASDANADTRDAIAAAFWTFRVVAGFSGFASHGHGGRGFPRVEEDSMRIAWKDLCCCHLVPDEVRRAVEAQSVTAAENCNVSAVCSGGNGMSIIDVCTHGLQT